MDGSHNHSLEGLHKEQSRILLLVMVVNFAMFLLEFVMGIRAGSTALMGDSLDMFADSLIYAFSLFVINKSEKVRASVALLKGLMIVAFAIWVFSASVIKIFSHTIPVASTMGWIGFLALLANTFCLILLRKHKDDDLNMRSTYLCSKNDMISNLGVMLGAFLVAALNSKWPDVVLGFIMAILFIKTSLPILSESLHVIFKKK